MVEMRWTRRRFLTTTGVTAGALVIGSAACSSDDDDPGTGTGEGEDDQADENGADAATGDVETDESGIPTAAAIAGWISQVFDQGIRRPGYPANRWAEDFVEAQFNEFGLEDVRREPVTAIRWEPTEWSLEVTPRGGDTTTLDCFPLPLSAPVDGLEVELAAWDPTDDQAVRDKASLYDVSLIGIPADSFASSGSAPADTSRRIVDSDGTLTGATHVVPFGAEFQEVMEPSMEAGAAAFIGSLKDYPGDSCEYYVPYDGVERDLPGVWISGSDGDWLTEQLGRGPVQVRLSVQSTTEEIETYNIVGELPGADDEVVMIGSHHDGPWSSAVEDASGISMVLAQAAYWSAQQAEARPHRLVFVLQAGHMFGGAGLRRYVEDHRAELESVVLEVHLEHASLEFAEEDGELVSTGQATPRWFFTSRIPELEAAVYDALSAQSLDRSLVVAPDAFGANPPTDGALYYAEGVPVMHFLAAPFYLFDKMDTLDKIDEDNLVPLTRATIQIIESTRGTSAAAMRAAVEAPPPQQ